MKKRYLTKSRFKLARECPTKLFYTKKEKYPNTKSDDSFLEALADGGFQVGELAKYYFPDGHDIHSLDYEEALSETSELLKLDNVIIYEAAVRFENLFVRVDILVKKGNRVRLIEVKAKSCKGGNPNQFLGASGAMSSSWSSYLEDIAFQKYVVRSAFSKCIITSSLMLIDKKSKSPTSGLNQKFRVVKDPKGRKGVKVSSSLNAEDLSAPLLTEIQVDDIVNGIFDGSIYKESPEVSFVDKVKFYSEQYLSDEKIESSLSKACGSCEFRIKPNKLKEGQISGFDECWHKQARLSARELQSPLVIDLWNKQTRKHLAEGIYLLERITKDDLNFKADDYGLSRTERQWLQIERVKDPSLGVYFDFEGLKQELNSFEYPLHFIDFETSAAAIPFNQGRSPYEQIAFQFSHHVLHSDGRVEHVGEYINCNPGEFPNYEFARALKSELENDTGTIFRYHNHENTILCAIKSQLEDDALPPQDSEELIEFIMSITHSTGNAVRKWKGERDMVDLQKLVTNFYYDPITSGSNSIKAILPAVLNSSKFLKEKYSQPAYGTPDIPSKNFSYHRWIEVEGGLVQNPYKTLPKVFSSTDLERLSLISNSEEINEGGAAASAYGYLQYVEMQDEERKAIKDALLRYCELDTMAMVMIYEAWIDWIKKGEIN